MKLNRSKKYFALISLLTVVLIILCVFLVRQYHAIVRQATVSTERVHINDLIRRHSLGVSDAGLIEPWMTFAYVGVSFKVPASYFVASLNISTSTPKYPNITISRYARMVATSSDVLVKAVRSAVQNYFASVGQ